MSPHVQKKAPQAPREWGMRAANEFTIGLLILSKTISTCTSLCMTNPSLGGRITADQSPVRAFSRVIRPHLTTLHTIPLPRNHTSRTYHTVHIAMTLATGHDGQYDAGARGLKA